MALSIVGGRLRQGGRNVELIASPYVGGPFPAASRFLVMHFTYGASARSTAGWFRNPDNPGSSAQVIVGREGQIIQCVSFDDVAWHAGASSWRGLTSLNNHSVGIELANWGYLRRSGNGWTSYTGVQVPSPFMAAHVNGNPRGYGADESIGWEQCAEEQFSVAAEVARAVLAYYPSIGEIIGHDDISAVGNGIQNRRLICSDFAK